MKREGLRIEVIGEARRPEDAPDLVLPVVAAAGRSNVGKSTLLNALLGRHRLLRTSRTPGCTRSIQFVSVTAPGAAFVLADLPGYGYAALSKDRREAWGPLIEGFLRNCRRLAAVMVLVDVRRGPEREEQQLIDFLDQIGAPLLVVLTKCDKLPRSQAQAAVERVRARLPGTETFAVAAAQDEGLDRLWRTLLARVAATAGAKPRAAARTKKEKAMENDPHRERFQAARAASQAGRHDEAIRECEAILAEAPTHRGALDLMGFAHFFKKEYAVAETWCRRTLAAHPGHPYAHKGLGLCLARQDRLEEGLKELREAIRLEPTFFDPYWDAAVVLREAGRFAEALELLRAGVTASPGYAKRAAPAIRDLEAKARGEKSSP